MIFAVKYGVCHQEWNLFRLVQKLESLKTLVNEDIDPLKRASKENNTVELGDVEDFGDEAIPVISDTCSITSSANSSVAPIQQNLSSSSTTIQPSSSESSNKTSRGKTSREKIERMLEN